jgi:AcrR family transcriptional regulator
VRVAEPGGGTAARSGKALRERIVAAALRCFERFGSKRTSLSDVADEAGLSRQSVYRAFESRSELIQFILDQRVQAMGASLESYFSAMPDIEEALVEGSMRSLAVARADDLFRDIVENSTDHSVESFLLHGTPAIRKMMHRLWDPIIDRARADGRLRRGVTNERFIDWLMGVHTMMRLRGDQSEAALRREFRDFFVPSLVASPRTTTRR